MPNLNRIILMGHLGRDPETRYTQSGRAVTTFSLCTNYNFKRGEEWQSVPEWHSIVCWGKQSEIAAEQFRKGDGVCVEGRMQYREWQDNNGNKRTTPEVVASLCWKFAPAPVNRKEEAQQCGRYTPPPPEDEVPF